MTNIEKLYSEMLSANFKCMMINQFMRQKENRGMTDINKCSDVLNDHLKNGIFCEIRFTS